MNPPPARDVERSHDNVSKLLRRGNGFPVSHSGNRPSNSPSAALLSELKDQIRQLAVRKLIHQVCRCLAAALIHSHIERSI
jgi:hypothetical protein